MGYFDNKGLVNDLEWVLADGRQLPSTTRCMRRDAYTVLVEREGSSERSLKNEDGFSPGLLIEK